MECPSLIQLDERACADIVHSTVEGAHLLLTHVGVPSNLSATPSGDKALMIAYRDLERAVEVISVSGGEFPGLIIMPYV